MIKEKIIEYLKEKGIKVDEKLLSYMERGTELTAQDELKHEFTGYPPNHNESWYFNFVDMEAEVFMVTRLSFEMHEKQSTIMLLLVVDGKPNAYFNRIKLERMPDTLSDGKVTYELLEQFKRWRIIFSSQRFDLDVVFDARWPVFNYLSAADPFELLERYGLKLLDVAAQQHYEQGMRVSGKLTLKRGHKSREINCFGHRDHSWGTRDWVAIDRWNWISAQFEDETINIARVEVLGKVMQNGFISNEKGNTAVKNVEIETKTEDDGKTPISSTFQITDEYGNKRTVVSTTIKSLYLPLPSPKGLTEVFEQIASFEIEGEGKKGNGISEYLISTRKNAG